MMMASPGKGFSPGKKLQRLLGNCSTGSDEPVIQRITDPIDDMDTHKGSTDIGKAPVVQIVPANHLNLLQNINPSDVEKLVNQYQQQLANDT